MLEFVLATACAISLQVQGRANGGETFNLGHYPTFEVRPIYDGTLTGLGPQEEIVVQFDPQDQRWHKGAWAFETLKVEPIVVCPAPKGER